MAGFSIPDISDELITPGNWMMTEVWYRAFELLERQLGTFGTEGGVGGCAPLTTGEEPLVFMSDGQGQAVMVPIA